MSLILVCCRVQHQQIIYLLSYSFWLVRSLITIHLEIKVILLIFHGYGLYVLNSENVIGRNAIFPESKSSDVRFRKDDIFSIFFVKRIAFSIGSDDKLHFVPLLIKQCSAIAQSCIIPFIIIYTKLV